MDTTLASSPDSSAELLVPAMPRTPVQSEAGVSCHDGELAEGWLIIVSGVQAGAETMLESGEPVTLGRETDNHIVLRDRSVAASRVKLLPTAEGVQLRVLAGVVMIDGELCTMNHEVLLGYGSGFSLGDVALAVEARDPAEHPAEPASENAFTPSSVDDRISMLDSSLLTPSVSELPETVATESDLSIAGSAPPPWYKRTGSMVAVLAMLGGIGLWVAGVMTPPEAPRISMAALLEPTSFSGLDVNQQDSMVQLSGYMESLDDSAELDRLIQLSGLDVDNQVLIGERITIQVSDIFRVNGIPAEVSVAEGGAVSIITHLPDESLLQRVEELVIEDVPGVALIEIDNRPPLVSEEDESPSPVDPGKRVAMVVSDAPAHIITEDKSRYFVGAILPSGHRLASINQGKVMLEKMGIKTVLEF